MMQKAVACVCFMVVLATAGCDSVNRNSPEITSEKGLPTLDARVKAEEIATDMILRRLATLEIQSSQQREKYAYAMFDPMDEGFQRVDSATGSFAVSVKSVRPYGDGVKVKLHLGNLSTATYDGVKLQLKYAVRAPSTDEADWYQRHSAWEATIKSKEYEVLTPLVPGSWNPTDIVLPGIDPQKFGYLTVRIETDEISLR